MKCPACGADNRGGAKFCNECGATLVIPVPETIEIEPAAAPTILVERTDDVPPSASVYQGLPSSDPTDLPPTHPEWRMSSAGPLPEPPKRRIWLWVIGVLVSCVLIFLLMNILLSGVAEKAAP